MRFHLNALRVSLTVAAASLVGPIGAQAASTTTTLPVAATVVSTCVVAATPLVFGNYSSTTATATEADSRIVVLCTPGAVYDVALDAGQNSNDVTARKLAGAGPGSDTLDYAIFRDAGRAQNWGTTPGSDTVTGTGTGADQVHTVYGSIPAQQAAAIGAYSDVVTVTVSY